MSNPTTFRSDSRRTSQQGSEPANYIRVRTGPRLVADQIATHRGLARPCTPQPSSLGKPGCGTGRRSHLFEVQSFVFANGKQALSGDDGKLLCELRSIQDYYNDMRRCAPIGKTTPEVQSADWTRIADLVNALKACPRFAELPPELSNPIEALQPLLGQPGQARYSAWTAFCRASQAWTNAAPAQPPSPPSRQVSAPVLAPPRKLDVSRHTACEADLRGLRAELDRLASKQVWKKGDTDVLARLCETGKTQSQIWGEEVAGLMGTVANALRLHAANADEWVRKLLAGVNQECSPA
jgi:hypothetical protein